MSWKKNFKRWMDSTDLDPELKAQLDELKANKKQLEPELFILPMKI